AAREEWHQESHRPSGTTETAWRIQRNQEGLRHSVELYEEIKIAHGLRRAQAARRSDRQWNNRSGLQGDIQSTPQAIRHALALRHGTIHRGLSDREPKWDLESRLESLDIVASG